MGTNFYTLKGKHLGKRSASGPYCWDCGRTLCLQGERYVHYTYVDEFCNKEPVVWLDRCPSCNKKYKRPKNLFSGSAGRELGFNKEPFAPKTGIHSCSSFSWAMKEFDAFKYKVVKDEYEQKFTMEEFKEMLTECPIRFHALIGKEFS